MLYGVSEIIVFVLLLPVVMNIILPLGMLAGWLVKQGIHIVVGERRPQARRVIRYAS